MHRIGKRGIIVPYENAAEAAVVDGIDVYPVRTLREAVDFIISAQLLKIGDRTRLMRLRNELMNKDWFMTLIDLEEYIKVKDKAFADYEDRRSWGRKMLTNIAQAGFFSSDRTIAEYNRDIWKL